MAPEEIGPARERGAEESGPAAEKAAGTVVHVSGSAAPRLAVRPRAAWTCDRVAGSCRDPAIRVPSSGRRRHYSPSRDVACPWPTPSFESSSAGARAHSTIALPRALARLLIRWASSPCLRDVVGTGSPVRWGAHPNAHTPIGRDRTDCRWGRARARSRARARRLRIKALSGLASGPGANADGHRLITASGS